MITKENTTHRTFKVPQKILTLMDMPSAIQCFNRHNYFYQYFINLQECKWKLPPEYIPIMYFLETTKHKVFLTSSFWNDF